MTPSNLPEGYDEALHELDRVSDEIRSSPGMRVRQDLAAVDTTTRIFAGNAAELSGHIQIARDPARWLPIASVDNRPEYPRFMDELDRYLHNYLASALSLCNCARGVQQRWWVSPTLRARYKEHNPWNSDGEIALMFWLRAAAQHERVPVAFSGTRARRDDEGRLVGEDYLALSLADLNALDWSRRTEHSAAARAHVDSLKDDPRLDPLVESFTSALLTFANWFGRELRRTQRAELDAVNKLIDQSRAVSAAMGWPALVRPTTTE